MSEVVERIGSGRRGDVIVVEVVIVRGTLGEFGRCPMPELNGSFGEADELESEVDKELSPCSGTVVDVEEFGRRKWCHGEVGGTVQHGRVELLQRLKAVGRVGGGFDI